MALSVRLVGPTGADLGAALVELTGPQKDRLVMAVIRRRTTLIRKGAVHRLAAQGMGRKIWGRDENGAGGSRAGEGGALKLIKGRVALKDNVFVATITLSGLPAMVEEGGRTAPHTIKPRDGGPLAFVEAGATLYASGPISHPGGRIPKVPHTAPEIDAETAALQQDIKAAMDGFVERVTSKGGR